MKHGFDLISPALEHTPHFGKKKQKLELNKMVVIQDPFELTRNTAAAVDKNIEGNRNLCKQHRTMGHSAKSSLIQKSKTTVERQTNKRFERDHKGRICASFYIFIYKQP